MTYELMERTVRDWVYSNPARGARDLSRLAGPAHPRRSPQEIADALVELAGRTHFARTRVW